MRVRDEIDRIKRALRHLRDGGEVDMIAMEAYLRDLERVELYVAELEKDSVSYGGPCKHCGKWS